MPTLPADEDYARSLLSIFITKRLRPTHSLGLDEVRKLFLTGNMGRHADFEAARDYAVSVGWLLAGFGRLRLTAPGGDEMQTICVGGGAGGAVQRQLSAPPARPLPEHH